MTYQWDILLRHIYKKQVFIWNERDFHLINLWSPLVIEKFNMPSLYDLGSIDESDKNLCDV